MLGTSPPTNWFQISEEIPSLLVIMSHREWDSRKGRRAEKGGRSQTSVTTSNYHMVNHKRLHDSQDIIWEGSSRGCVVILQIKGITIFPGTYPALQILKGPIS